MRSEWVVYVLQPRKSGREGRNLRVKAVPPDDLRRAGVLVRRKSAGTTDEAAAATFARRWAGLLNSAVLVGEDPLAIDVLDKHRAWRESGGETAESTLVAYAQAVRRLRGPLDGVLASGLTRAVVLRARDELARAQKLGPGTINQTVNCLRKAWSWAHEREWVATEFPRVGKLKAPATEKRPMTDTEVDAVLAWIAAYRGGRWLPFFALLADTGARVSELLALRGRDLDRAAGVVRVGRVRKTEESVRSLRPPPQTLALVPAAAPDALVFPAQRPGCRGELPVTRRVPLGVMWRALEALDLEDVDLHSFRRSWITSAHEAGVPLHVSMRSTGHTSTAVHLSYARRASHDLGVASAAVRSRRGHRPWEEHTAPHRPNPGPDGAPKSSGIPLASPVPVSYWSGQPDADRSPPQDDPSPRTAPAASPQAPADRLGALLPWGGGHPLGERIAALAALDLDALIDAGDPVVRSGLIAYRESREMSQRAAQ
jgi:integrase